MAIEYDRLIRGIGNEFKIYESGAEKIRAVAEPRVAEAIAQVNSGKVGWNAGYDGVFGELVLGNRNGEKTDNGKKQKGLGDFF